jgi:hypothetical protein
VGLLLAGQSGLNFFRAYRVVVETVETVLSSFYLYIAHDLNRGLCKLPEKNGFNHLNEAKIFQTRLPCCFWGVGLEGAFEFNTFAHPQNVTNGNSVRPYWQHPPGRTKQTPQ